jgi:hypothetical protein
MGISFGSYFVPRAPAFEKRISRLCIANSGNISWGASIAGAFRKVIQLPKFLRPASIASMVQDYAWKYGVKDKIAIASEELQAITIRLRL